jgi:tetratricopeptide (TPR) repeat protein
VLLGGCVTPQVAQLSGEAHAGLAPSAEIESVPFFPQEDYQCGPAALAEVLVHAGRAVSPESLVKEVYLPAREGSLQAEMLASARRHGTVAWRLAPRLADLLREVSAGTPVIVLQNLAFGFAPVWHYAVVVGYDLPREEIVLRSGLTRRLAMTLVNFERVWARSGYWAMVAMPPRRLPQTAAAQDYVNAVAALERVDARAAREAYASVLERWPGNLAARLGLGNAAYALRDLPASEAQYRRATEAHPASADAWNNLAQALFDLGRKDEALEAAQKAVALGGPRLAQYRATLEQITGTLKR